MSSVDLGVLAGTFLLILPSELPDKTFVASLVLATRYPRLPVWVGVTAAFGVQSLIAVSAAWLLTLLPERALAWAAAALFGTGAVVMLRGGLAAREEWRGQLQVEMAGAAPPQAGNEGAVPAAGSTLTALAGSFGLIFLAEWGDLSQLLTAGLAVRSGEPVSVFLGAWAALATVAALAVFAGSWLATHVPLHRVRLVAAALLAVLSALALWDAVKG